MSQNPEAAVVPWTPFQIMESVEDDLIVRELQGEVVDTWVYRFPSKDGKEIVGLSKAGVDAAASEMAKKGEVLREIEKELVFDLPDSIIAVVKAGRFLVSQDGREVLLETVFGTKRQPRKKEFYVRDRNGKPIIRDGQPVKRLEEDPFVVETAMVKAGRNAKRRLMPESLIAKVIALATKSGKVKKLEPPSEAPAEAPKAGEPLASAKMNGHQFVAKAKEKGYADWTQVLEALGVPSAKDVAVMGYETALDQLPDKTAKPAPQPAEAEEIDF